MNTQITLDHLAELKLHGMARAYEAVLSMPLQDQPSINQFIARLAEAEIQDRTHKRTEKFLLQSKLRYNAVLEQVHCNTNRNLSQEKLMMVADCSIVSGLKVVLLILVSLLLVRWTPVLIILVLIILVSLVRSVSL
jgi:hypothetical protein